MITESFQFWPGLPHDAVDFRRVSRVNGCVGSGVLGQAGRLWNRILDLPRPLRTSWAHSGHSAVCLLAGRKFMIGVYRFRQSGTFIYLGR